MPEHVSDTVSISKKSMSRLITIALLVIVLGAGWFWWNNIHTSSDNVFWGMIENNLATTGITRHVTQKSQDQSIDQYIQLQFGAQLSSHSLVTLTQTQDGNVSTVKSESIGTPTNDYNRYIKVDAAQKTASGKTIDATRIVGVWAKTDDASPGQPPNAQQLRQAILTIVPFGYLSAQNRTEFVKMMKDKKVYDISDGNIKSDKIDGRPVYVYEVTVNPKAYIEVMQQFAKYLGLGDIGLNPSQYEGSPVFKANMTVGKMSRQLVKISFANGAQEESYNSQGLLPNIVLPTGTIPLSELQNRVQQSLQ